MKKDIKDYVGRYLKCQISKIELIKSHGFLQPLGVLNLKWESITMDFIVSLPRTSIGYDSIFVVVDRLTKFARFIPTIITITTSNVAELFMKHIFGNHGLPSKIINDRDHKFISEFWSSLFKLCGRKIRAYHPKTDGQIERTTQILEDMLRMYVGKKQHSWDKWLHLVQFFYNNTTHSSIGVSPFCTL